MSEIFGFGLKKLREIKKLKQADIAKIANVHQKTISSWENNAQEPSIDIIKKLAKFFKVSTDYLTGFDQETQEALLKVYHDIQIEIQIEQHEKEEELKTEYLIEKHQNENYPDVVSFDRNEYEQWLATQDEGDEYDKWIEAQEAIENSSFVNEMLQKIYNIEPKPTKKG